MYYYYDIATGEYTGCGNESTAPAGCEARTTPPEQPVLQNTRIAEIKAELAALDIKRIRPIAENDINFLMVLNAQSLALRTELQELL